MSLKLKDIFETADFAEVWDALIECYPDQEEAYYDYAEMFDQLMEMEPSANPSGILIRVECCADEEDGEQFYDVFGMQAGRLEQYALELVPWEDWLGFGLTLDTVERMSDPEIIAHCLYEMSFLSFDQNEIADIYDEMVRRAQLNGQSDWMVGYDELMHDRDD
jgi:hypothetical protein